MSSSWLDISPDSVFSLENLPYGVFSLEGEAARLGVAVGQYVVDLVALANQGLLPNEDGALEQTTLGGLFARGRQGWSEMRTRLIDLLDNRKYQQAVRSSLVSMDQVQMHLPFEVGDYVDFYSFRHHAENLGRILRPGSEPLLPNWRYLPIGYHGRSGTIAISETPVRRPWGQRKDSANPEPTFGPSQKLDIEVEVGFVIGTGSEIGKPLKPDDFADHVFGVVLVNDWSARDLQAWEYVPLGPFLGKSFLTSISPWVVTLDALSGARVMPPKQELKPLGYLVDEDPWALDIDLEVVINGNVVSRPRFGEMYWTPGQQLAHMTSNGASTRPGDLFASGTVSGPQTSEWGSLIELTWNGTKPLQLSDGTELGFLRDGDTVTISATAPSNGGGRIGFGEVSGKIVGREYH